MTPYAIISPDYDPTSGGIKVMWALYGWLLAKGVEVYMNRWPNGDVIAIYPEIEGRYPVPTSKVVRYVLNTPGVMTMRDSYGRQLPAPTSFDGEKVYYFSRMFGKAEDENHYMFLPAIHIATFKDQHKKRTKTCYLVGKGQNRHEHPESSIELNREIARDQSKLADILNECHTFYCYDDLTAMMEVARLCGVKVAYFGKYTLKELKNYEPGISGINSPLSVWRFREHYQSLIADFEYKLDKFIIETQQW